MSNFTQCQHGVPYTKICVECEIIHNEAMLKSYNVDVRIIEIKIFKLQLRLLNETRQGVGKNEIQN